MNTWYVIVRRFHHPREIDQLRTEILHSTHPEPREASAQNYFGIFQTIDWRKNEVCFCFTPAAAQELHRFLTAIGAEPCITPLRTEHTELILGDKRAWGMIR